MRAFVLALLAFVAVAQDKAPALGFQLPAVEAGAQTRGGVADNASVLVVTTLADAGPGSLRAAVEEDGPRVIVFEVAGEIWLHADLLIKSPFVTIAGQTAPSPGITIRGATVSVRTHNVVLQHLAMRPGASQEAEANRERDALSISSCGGCRQPSQDVRIENVSVSWAVDENIGMWGPTLDRVTVRNSIIAEALNEAGHPKGAHSMGLLIGKRVQGVAVTGNFFTGNVNRNPVISAGVSALVANNLIYNPGRTAIHFYPGPLIRATVVGNVVRSGPSTKKGLRLLDAPDSFIRESDDALIFARDNRCCGDGNEDAMTIADSIRLIGYPPVQSAAWQPRPADEVVQWVTTFAGTRPGERDGVDTRLFSEFERGGGRIVDRQNGWSSPFAIEQVFRKLELPDLPFHRLDPQKELRRIEAWLCERHLDIGGPPTPECPREIGFYREKLTQ